MFQHHGGVLPHRSALGCLALGLAACALPPPVGARQGDADLARVLRGRIEALRATGRGTAAGRALLASVALPAFYEARGFEPVWVGSSGLPRLEQLTATIGSVTVHGLDPRDYNHAELEELRPRAARTGAAVGDLVDLELLASDAFLVLGSHLLHGRVNPETINPEWLANRRNTALEVILERAVSTESIAASLESLAPTQTRYRRMIAAASRMREIAGGGGWARVPEGPSLSAGAWGSRVSALRERLRATGDLTAGSSDEEHFDADLERAVRRFQARHGLDMDGVVGASTTAALNVPAEERARQIEVNLERWRWLPADLGDRHVEVNIAGFGATLVEDGTALRTYRVVVGRRYRQTPMFSGLMSYLVLSPFWHVPPNIAALDKLPLIRSDPSTIAAQRMTLLDHATNQPVDPATVDWSTMSGPEFNRLYRLRQDPGPANALGAVKFMFPNKHNVYLHDTPSRELFERASRDFSSGCIRVEDALDLAEYLLADQPDWTRSRIDSVAAAGVERTVRLLEPVPVHLLYWTAWADADGVIHFREDIYGRDGAVRRALSAPPPGP
jgi:murein L,D-transpeptidase YcbB/YkuD